MGGWRLSGTKLSLAAGASRIRTIGLAEGAIGAVAAWPSYPSRMRRARDLNLAPSSNELVMN